MSAQLVLIAFAPSTSSAADSPVRISPTLAREPGSRASVPAFGANTLESFASFDPVSLLWRTSQRSLLGGWVMFSETWPRSGMMQSGIASAPVMLARPIGESGCSLWPTPSAANPNAQESLETWQARREELKAKGTNGNGCGTPLGVAVRLEWATPTARDWKSGQASDATMARNSRPLNEQVANWPTPAARDSIIGAYTEEARRRRVDSGKQVGLTEMVSGAMLNPAWVESLMGFPPGWTDGLPVPAKSSTRGKRRAPSDDATTERRASKPLATRSSRKSRKSSAGS